MKISDEERREVAMSLRTAKQSELWRLSDGELIDTVADAIGVDGMSRHYEAAMFDRLADLIDRPTCSNAYDDSGMHVAAHVTWFDCSECHLQFQEVATRNFQAYMNEMEAWCRNIANEVESRIKEAEKEVE